MIDGIPLHRWLWAAAKEVLGVTWHYEVDAANYWLPCEAEWMRKR